MERPVGERQPTATVFIGNIPYDVTEQMLMDMFGQAGPIKSLRMVTDKDSGKPKGYGFCEYHDVQTAQSAVRNLNKYEVNGRMLRVDFADEHTDMRGKRDKRDGGGMAGGGDMRGGRDQSLVPGPPPGTRPIGREASNAAAQHANALLGNAPYTGPSQDKISTVIAGMTPMQLFEILSQMKTLCATNHAAARSILVANPQLSKALFQAQVLLGLVKGNAPPPSTLGGIAPPPAGPPPPQQQQQQQPPPGPLMGLGPPGGPPPTQGPPQPQYGGPPPYGGPQGQPPPLQGPPQPPVVVGGVPVAGQVLIDPTTGLPYNAPPGAVLVPAGQPPPQAPPPQPQPPPPLVVQPPPLPVPAPQPIGPPPTQAPGPAPDAAMPVPSNLAPQQAQVLQQVLSLTQAQIDALPPAQRQQVLMVRQQLGLAQPQ